MEKGRADRGLCQGQIPHYLGNTFSLVFIFSYQYNQYNQLADDDEDGDDLLFEIENVDDQVFPLVPDSMVDSSALESIPESTAESRAADPLGATYRDDPHDSDEDLLV